ncbi:hypothetical protein [Microbulbifer sp. 2205BS26-8]|uniref:hypothetical protein n=1 Tax=Microbulbifer sp. 2205BS26-8 TaxID=3064386 RepID=UPI00273F31D7|nr:hypothetical protein [Microbulbifer sp. 2205BS26-8]MDP5210230.1 hypothetical protein [Microbulbifer sp. 2205BS26-8]
MEEVIYILDLEGGVDPNEPLGSIVLNDNQDNKIVIENTYIDAWLMAIGDFLLAENNPQRIEVLEEPEVIRALANGNLLQLSYRGSMISVDLQAFSRQVAIAMDCLIKELLKYSTQCATTNIVFLEKKLVAIKKKMNLA